MTAVHYAIELDRFEYLTYLFEGDPKVKPEGDSSPKTNQTQTEDMSKTYKLHNRSTS
jgi:hypothetical protein